jgi:predicted Zn-ribbon and HTH transcriptional regulator
MLNVETGEIMSTLEWLVKQEKRMSKPVNIKIPTATCPKCEYRPIPVVEDKPTICPVCSHVINGGKHGK